MEQHAHHVMHRHRAEQLQREAATHAATRSLRRARRFERLARWADAGASASARLSGMLTARARASRARLP